MLFIKNMLLLISAGFSIFSSFNQEDISAGNVKDLLVQDWEEMYALNSEQIQLKELDKIILEGNMVNWIGKSKEELTAVFGKPKRKDKSAYHYTWWIYTDHNNYVYQFGVENEKIETVYVIGDHLKSEPVATGQTYEELNRKFSFQNEVPYENELSSYTFRLTQEDMETRPLIKINDHVFMQLYFDTFTNKLSSFRVMTADTLLTQRPYEIEYRGDLPEQPDLSDEQWEEVERGMEQQIFDITNVMRNIHGVSVLEWEQSAQSVAYSHSIDMAINDYFSHTSLNGDGLKERLDAKDVFYITAGENIAAGYIDALSAMEGWLNSEGHREALLSEDYTHLGVGVYKLYYTQNFLEQPL